MDIRHMLQHVLGKPEAKEDGKVIQIKTLQDCEALFQMEFAILFKHSLSCSFSLHKFDEIVDLCSNHPEMTVHVLSVQIARAASLTVEDHTGIRHETPQVLVMRKGVVIAHSSRGRITEKFLADLPKLAVKGDER